MNPRRHTKGHEWCIRAASVALVLFASACGPVIALLDQRATSVAATGAAVIAGTRDQRATSAAATVRATVLGTPVPGRPTRTPYVSPTLAPPPAATDTAPAATDTASAPVATPVEGVLGPEAILILEPGPGSSVAFPVHVAGEADPTFEQSLVVQITGADGTVITTAPTQINADIGQRGPFGVDVPFNVSADQPGRISVYSASARDGGLIHLASVEVTLLASGGAASLAPGQPHEESLAIFSPLVLAAVSGSVAHVTGFSDYVFENQLGVVICGEGGAGAPHPICGTADNVLGAGTAYVNSPDIGQPGPFTADVPYAVTAQVHRRIVVYDSSPRDGGITHLSSREVTLAP